MCKGNVRFLEALNVTNVAKGRNDSSVAVVAASARQIGAIPATTYISSPVFESRLVPDQLYALFKAGNYCKSVKVLSSHTPFEGGSFLRRSHDG